MISFIIRHKKPPKIRVIILINLLVSFYEIPKTNTITKDVSLTINPANPAELKRSILSDEETKRTIIPDGTPKIVAARNTGISERSNFKKGKTGKIESLPKYPSISVITINTELYVILSVLFLIIYFDSLTYTKY